MSIALVWLGSGDRGTMCVDGRRDICVPSAIPVVVRSLSETEYLEFAEPSLTWAYVGVCVPPLAIASGTRWVATDFVRCSSALFLLRALLDGQSGRCYFYFVYLERSSVIMTC